MKTFVLTFMSYKQILVVVLPTNENAASSEAALLYQLIFILISRKQMLFIIPTQAS